MDANEVKARLDQYVFYHTIPVTNTLMTPGWPAVVPIVNMVLDAMSTLDLKSKRVLDIGCRDGLFSFEAEKLGASEVVGIDSHPSAGATELLIPFFRSKVQLREFNLFDLKPETFGLFDVILFPGVLYHLRYPFWALKLIKDLLRPDGQLLLEAAVFADKNEYPLLFCPTGTDSPYEPTSCTFFNLKGLTSTLQSMGFTVRQTRTLHNAPPEPEGRPTVIDRACLTCRLSPAEIDKDVLTYWDQGKPLPAAVSAGQALYAAKS